MKNLHLFKSKFPLGGFRRLRLLVCGVMCMVKITAQAQTAIPGSNLFWSISGTTLTISGIGDMPNYSNLSYPLYTTAPWYSYVNSITDVDIVNGVTSVGDFAFFRYGALTSVTIPNSVTSIGNSAFNQCSKLMIVSIGNSVEYIGTSAFSTCSALKSIIIPNLVVNIGSSAFQNCSGLTSIDIPESVKTIGTLAFNGCSDLKSVNFYATNCTTMGGSSSSNMVFNNCDNLTEVNIGSKVTIIPSYAFRGCSGLTSITIPDLVESIGSYAFYDCTGLKSVVIGNSVVSIGDHAFHNCSGLTSITIPNLVESIGTYAFNSCSGLTSVTIPDLVESVGTCAFQYCSGLTSVTIGNSVKSVGSSAFQYCSGLAYVTIGNSVESIGGSAFNSCLNLMSIECKNPVPPVIANVNAFPGILYPVIHLYVPHESMYAYYTTDFWKNMYLTGKDTGGKLYSLTLLQIEEGEPVVTVNGTNELWLITKMSEPLTVALRAGNPTNFHVLANGENITATLQSERTMSFAPQNVNYIYTYQMAVEQKYTVLVNSGGTLINSIGMSNIENVRELVVSGYLNSVDILTIRRMTNLVVLDMENARIINGGASYYQSYTTSEDKIGAYFFFDKTKLAIVALPDNVSEIGDNTFDGCISLRYIVIPPSVASISDNSFRNCTALERVTVENSDKSISISSNSFTNCTLRSLYLGREMKLADIFNASPFRSKSTLRTLILGDEVTFVETDDFYNCTSLISLTLGRKINNIANSAFADCRGLRELNSKSPVPPEAFANTFQNVPKGSNAASEERCILYVPLDGTLLYWLHPPWKDFFDIREKDFLASDAFLTNLMAPPGVLKPGFKLDKYNYELEVPEGVNKINIGAIASHPEATLIGTGERLLTGVGETFSVTVVSKDGTDRRTYKLTVVAGGLSELLDEDFETDMENWKFANENQTNKWAIGTAVAQSGNRSAYISNDGGKTNAYSINSESVSHLYRDVYFTPSTGSYQLQFDWKGFGEYDNEYLYDYWEVFLLETSVVPQEGVELYDDYSPYCIWYDAGSAAWQHKSFTLPASLSGTTKRLVFSWINDESYGTQPPVAIDNVKITFTALSDDATLSVLTVTPGGLSPIFNSSITDYTVHVGNEVSSVTIAATTTNPNAKVDGTGNRSLNVGDNSCYIVVTAEDGATTRTYTVNVFREGVVASNDASLSGVTVNGVAATLKTGSADTYSITINYTDNINIVATANSNKSSVTGQTGAQSVSVGLNTFAFRVTAENGTTFNDYRLEVIVNASVSVTVVTVSPNPVSVPKGGQRQFTANVTATGGASEAVSWAVSGNDLTATKIDAAGMLIVAAGETAPTLTVTATSMFDTSKQGTATVTVVEAGTPMVTGVTVLPNPVGVPKGSQQQFTANVTATGGASEVVSWAVSGNDLTATKIDADGMLAVAAGETAPTLTVTATSVFDNTKKGTATVTVTVENITNAEIPDAPLARVYPNPTENKITIELEVAGEYALTLSDINGKVLLRQTVSDEITQLDISNYPSGVYLLTIDDGKRQSATRVVKN